MDLNPYTLTMQAIATKVAISAGRSCYSIEDVLDDMGAYDCFKAMNPYERMSVAHAIEHLIDTATITVSWATAEAAV